MSQKEDRRVRLTKRALRESLVELMQQHPISKISVTMLCEAADINRSTFYAHYADPYDLLHQIQREVVAGFKEQILREGFAEESETTASVLVQVLQRAREEADLFRVLLGDDSDDSFKRELMFLAQEKTIARIRADSRLESTAKYLEIFAINGCVSLLRKWLEDGCPEEPAAMAGLITRLLFEGIRAGV